MSAHHRRFRSGVYDGRSGSGGGAPPDLTSGLVSHWKLDEAADELRADSVTATANGLANNGSVGQAAGKIGNAAVFDGGSSNYLNGDESLIPAGNADFTWAAWAYLTADGSFPMVISTGGGGYELRFNGSTRIPQFIGVLSSVSASAGAVTKDAWHFLVGYRRSGVLGLSVNGAAAEEAVLAADGTHAHFSVGSRNGSNPFVGRIDSVSVWSRVLTGTEIAYLYNEGAGRDYPFS